MIILEKKNTNIIYVNYINSRIDIFILKYINNCSRNKIQKDIKYGKILVNNKKIKSNYKVKNFDNIKFLIDYDSNLKINKKIIPENIYLNILYEDENIAILNKPAGMVVHPGHGNYSGTLANALIYHFGKLPSLNNDFNRPGIVHRIDKNTSGIMVIAKNIESLYNLYNQFYYHIIKRKYIALVWGDLKKDKGTIDINIGRNLKNRKKMSVFFKNIGGKKAITHYNVIERFKYLTLISCYLETGRTHQIRVHLKYLGHPIFNDEIYGGNKILNNIFKSKNKLFIIECFKTLPRHALHSKSIKMIHPINKKFINIECPIPDDMNYVIKKWRKFIE